ncbi:hypothetical protein [Longitalea arenae]|nr:hypothetical protein [Longitalea arenae]
MATDSIVLLLSGYNRTGPVAGGEAKFSAYTIVYRVFIYSKKLLWKET